MTNGKPSDRHFLHTINVFKFRQTRVGVAREQRRLETLCASVAANRRALDLATDRYTSGLENFLSVLDAQRALYTAENGVADSETTSMVSLIAVYKALGGGWALDEHTR